MDTNNHECDLVDEESDLEIEPHNNKQTSAELQMDNKNNTEANIDLNDNKQLSFEFQMDTNNNEANIDLNDDKNCTLALAQHQKEQQISAKSQIDTNNHEQLKKIPKKRGRPHGSLHSKNDKFSEPIRKSPRIAQHPCTSSLQLPCTSSSQLPCTTSSQLPCTSSSQLPCTSNSQLSELHGSQHPITTLQLLIESDDVQLEHDLNKQEYYLKFENKNNACYANSIVQALFSFNRTTLTKVINKVILLFLFY